MKRDTGNTNRKQKRKFTLAVCLFFMAYVLSGCGGENGDPEEQTSTYVYVAQQLASSPSGGYSLPEGFGNPAVEGGKLYYMREIYESPDEDFQTGDPQTEERPMSVVGHTVERAVFSEDDCAVDFAGAEVLLSIPAYPYEKKEGGTGSEDEVLAMLDMVIDGESIPPMMNGLVLTQPEKDYFRFNIQGYAVDQEQNVYFALDCCQGSYPPMESMGTVLCKRTPEGEWAYRRFFSGMETVGIAVDGNGGVYLLTLEGILTADRDGRETGMTGTEEYKGKNYSSERLLGDSRGNVYYFVLEAYNSRWKGMEVAPRDRKGLKEIKGLSGSSWLNTCTVFQGNVFFSVSENLYEYDGETESAREILLWNNSGLIGSNIRDCIVLERERLLVWYDEPGMEGLYLLVKTPVEELPEKKAVVLAAFDISMELGNAVIRFNRLNDKYQVVLESYGYSDETASGAQTRLDAALVSSTPPDLLSLSGRNLEKDMEKGLLEDLLPRLESSMLDRMDFLENALEGYTIKGCLVGIPVRFYPTAVGGRTSQVGGLDSWTMEDVYALAERYPEQNVLLSDATYEADTRKRTRTLETREHLLGSFCAAWYLEEYIDWEKGQCHFDSEGFRRMLRWVGEHSEEQPAADPRTQTVKTSGYTFRTRGYLPEEALLMENYIDFRDAVLWEIQCGGDLTLTGFPTADGRGTASLHVESPLGIVAGAGNREGAWEFLEYYISSSMDGEWTYGLPTSKSRLQELKEQAVTETRKSAYILDGETIPDYNTSSEIAEKLMELLEASDFTPESGLRDMVVSIILEETAPYYTGGKSLDEVVGIIQNRVQLLLDENK